MKITAYFSDGGTPKTGLTPSIDGWEVGASQVITAQSMTEQAGGWYYYEFTGYDETKDYVFRCDGGATLSGYDRYTSGSNRDDLEMSGKLPTNNFMGSSIKGDKDGNIDSIETHTGTDIPTTITTMQSDLDNPAQYKAAGFSTHAAADVWGVGTKVITGGVLTTPDDYKATGFSTHNAAAVWSAASRELSTPANYKADVTNLDQAISTTESNIRGGTETLESLKTLIDALNDIAAADVWAETGRALSTPADYKADVTNLDAAITSRAPASEYDSELSRLLGLVDENSYIDNYTFSEGKMAGCRKRVYDSKANAQAHGATGLLATYTITVLWDGNDILSYLAVKD